MLGENFVSASAGFESGGFRAVSRGGGHYVRAWGFLQGI